MICGGILNMRGLLLVPNSAGVAGGGWILVRSHVRNMAAARRFGFTGFVFYSTFFVELIWQTSCRKGLPSILNGEKAARPEDVPGSPALLPRLDPRESDSAQFLV